MIEQSTFGPLLFFGVILALVTMGALLKMLWETFVFEYEERQAQKKSLPYAKAHQDLTRGKQLRHFDVLDLTTTNQLTYHHLIVSKMDEDGVWGYFRPSISYFSQLYRWEDILSVELVGRDAGDFWKNKPIYLDGLQYQKERLPT
jgi:hypothetical protein